MHRPRLALGSIALVLVACSGGGNSPPPAVDAAGDEGDAPVVEVDAAVPIDAAPPVLGQVTATQDVTCPTGAPARTLCRRVTVSGCPGLAGEPIDAVIAVRFANTAGLRGTIVHLSGGGGTGFQTGGEQAYSGANFTQVFVAWGRAWEQTAGAGIGAAACRPATLLRWIFDEVHGGSTVLAYCGEGFSGGSGQLGYALARYGAGDYLDYVNELSGPPFARIDLGCDGDAPATATVCGAPVTMRLPAVLDGWEHIAPPLSCGATGVPPAELARWRADSILAPGAALAYPRTRVEFFDCTNRATAVTGMAQLYHDAIAGSAGGVAFHCYSAAEGCMGEALGTGNADAVAAMIAGCTARH